MRFWNTPFQHLLAWATVVHAAPLCALTGDLLGNDSPFRIPLAASPFEGRSLQAALNPFADNTSITARRLNDLLRRGATDTKQYLRGSLAESGLATIVESVLADDGNVRFRVEGRPVCKRHMRLTKFEDGAAVATGTFPQASHVSSSNEDSLELRQMAWSHVESALNAEPSAEITSCFWDDGESFVPAWEFESISNGRPFVAWSSVDRLIDFEWRSFDADGVSRVYATSPATKKLVDVTLRSLLGDGTLTSTYFTTDPIGQSRAVSSSNEFIYDTGDVRFSEASAFTHASLMYAFFKELGYQWQPNQFITISLHDTPGNTQNNAEYTPGSGSSSPKIRIGDGDGEILQNLPLDAEVVSHELGHHVVFNYLKSTKGPSLTVHEAFADFFTLAKNDDPCLADSVCPTTAFAYPRGACWVAGKCLRTADNTLKLNDSLVSSDGHRRGQVVSGLLWDLRNLYGIGKTEVTKIAFTAVKYFAETITYSDFITALMSADREIYKSKYSCTILAAAKGRGFGSEIASLTCSGLIYGKDGKTSSYADRLVNLSSDQDNPGEEKKIVCSTILGASDRRASLVILLLPLVLMLLGFRRSLLALVFATGMLGFPNSSFAKDETSAAKRTKVRILVSLIWEGYDISPHNVEALENMRRNLGETLQLTHVVSPAYFLHPTFTPDKWTLMQKVIKATDKVALYIQPWKSIAEEANVVFRTRPTFWGTPVARNECTLDCGRQVPISIYNDREIQAMIESSLKALSKKGFNDVTSFMTSGWMTSAALLETAAVLGLKEDFSMIAPEGVASKLTGYPILNWLHSAWPNIRPGRESRLVKTRAGDVRQIPHVPGIADYFSESEILAQSGKVFTTANDRGRGDFVVHLSLIQETAAQYASRVTASLPRIVSDAQNKAITLINYWDRSPFGVAGAPADPRAAAAVKKAREQRDTSNRAH